MKQSSGILERGRRLQQVLDWAQSAWLFPDGDWQTAETMLRQFITEELGEHVIDSSLSPQDEMESYLAQTSGHPLTRQPWWQPPLEKFTGTKLPPVTTQPFPTQMDALHRQLFTIVWYILKAKEQGFALQPHPYSVTYNPSVVITPGLVRFRTIPEGSLRDLVIAAFLHCLQELDTPRLCACPECQHAFVRTGRRRFCSDRCASRATSRTYRQKHPDKHRRSAALAARKRYEQKITKEGKRKIKISPRRRKYPDES
jgi:hypothetical protein